MRQNLLLLGLGSIAGFSSGLTGTGGPLISVPLMIMFGFPPLMTIGASQVIQILAAVSGILGNLRYGSIDFSLVPLIVAFEVLGVLIGAKIVHGVNVVLVRKFVAWLCLMIGLGLFANSLFGAALDPG
ncbi:MAG: sulfite exporter TauE/SafE family protein [Thiohalocapsa sp.]